MLNDGQQGLQDAVSNQEISGAVLFHAEAVVRGFLIIIYFWPDDGESQGTHDNGLQGLLLFIFLFLEGGEAIAV